MTARVPAEMPARASSTRPAARRHEPPPPRRIETKAPVPPSWAAPPSDPEAGNATAIYVTGSSSLEPGRRYAIAIGDGRLRVLGPMDVEPDTVALDRAIAGMEAATVNGRLMVSEPGVRGGTMLAFMAIVGPTPDQLADRITREGGGGDQLP